MQVGDFDIQTFCSGLLENNSYLISEPQSNEGVLVDCPDGNHSVLKAIQQQGLKLKYVVLTHGHFDHCLGLDNVSQLFEQVPVYLHQNDKVIFENISNDLQSFGLGSALIKTQPTYLTETLTELTLGDKQFKLQLTPGHTPGHLSLIWSGGVCCGDVLFYRGIGRTDLFGGNERILYDTIQTHFFSLPPNTIVFPGHGPTTTIDQEQKYNPFLGQFGRI